MGFLPPNFMLYDIDPNLPGELARYRLEKQYMKDQEVLRSILL